MPKTTIVLGASTNPTRYSYLASQRLADAGHSVVPIGIRSGKIDNIEIIVGQPVLDEVDTITVYLSPENQTGYYDYIINLKPNRIIFNPGSENPELVHLARKNGIESTIACTLVMLSTGQY